MRSLLLLLSSIYCCFHFHNVLRLFDVLPNFSYTQVKRCAIIIYKHGTYELPQGLPKYLRLRILGNTRKESKRHRFIVKCPVPLPK